MKESLYVVAILLKAFLFSSILVNSFNRHPGIRFQYQQKPIVLSHLEVSSTTTRYKTELFADVQQQEATEDEAYEEPADELNTAGERWLQIIYKPILSYYICNDL